RIRFLPTSQRRKDEITRGCMPRKKGSCLADAARIAVHPSNTGYRCEARGETMTICETCGYEIRDGKKHESDGDGSCQIIEVDTERVVGFAHRKQRDLYKKR